MSRWSLYSEAMARFEIVTADAALMARLDELAEEAALAGIRNVGRLTR